MWELDYKESWVLKNLCFSTVVLEKTLESPLDCKEIQPVHPEEDCPGYSLEGLMLQLKLQYFGHLMRRVDSWKRPWCWEGLGAGGEGDNRGWDGWMAPPTRWTWVWVNSGSWWWTGRPSVLWFMGSQGVGHNWMTELNWTERWGDRPVDAPVASDLWAAFSLAWQSEAAAWISRNISNFHLNELSLETLGRYHKWEAHKFS